MTSSNPKSHAMLVPVPELETRFEVLGELARSATGQTLRVRSRQFESQVESRQGERQVPRTTRILELRRGAVEDGALEAARRLLDLRHPGLAPIEEIERFDGGVYWLRADFGDVTLERLLESGAVELTVALALLDQVLEALQALHGAGFWVRNLSPADLYLQPGGRIVLCDLGLGHGLLADQVPDATAVFVGRLRFASPEQFEHEAKVGPASDLYAVGLIAFELLTGRFPIAGESPSSLIAGHLFRPPMEFAAADAEGRVPELVRAWVLARLAKRPQERGDLLSVRRALAVLRADLGAPDWAPLEALFEPQTGPGSAFELVEKALEAGELAEARRHIEALRLESPGAELEEMARRLAAVEGFTHAADVHRLVSEAQRRLDSGSPSAAVGCLEEAKSLVPDDGEVQRLLELAKRTALRSAQGRGDGPTAMLGQVQAMIEQEGAERRRRTEREQASRGAKNDRLLERARASAQSEDFDAARHALEAVLADVPDHPEALALGASIDAIQRIRREEAAQSQRLERTVGDIRGLLEVGDASAAQQQLEQATERYGDAELLDTVRFDVTRARLDSEVNRTVQLSPEQLQAAIAAETTSRADQASAPNVTQQIPAELLAEASRGDEELPSTVTLGPDQIEAARQRALRHVHGGHIQGGHVQGADVRRGGGSVTLPMETIEAAKKRALELRAREEAAAASSGGGLTSPAIRTPGPGSVTLPMQTVQAAKKRAQEAMAAEEMAAEEMAAEERVPQKTTLQERRRSAPVPASTAPAASSPPPPPAASSPPPKPAATAPMSSSPPAPAAPSPPPPSPAAVSPPPSVSPPPASTAPPASASTSPPASTAPTDFRLDDLGFGGPAPPGTAGPRPSSTRPPSSSTSAARRRAAPPGRGPNRPLLAVVVLLALGAVFAASYLLSGRMDTLTGWLGSTETAELEPEDVKAADDLDPGVLLLDGSPWAEIESIRDGAGEPVEIVGARFTPKRLELAPGVYTLTLVHPGAASQQATLQVESGGEHRLAVSFEVDVEEFFRRADW